jgi:CubicO group peptidase (beta-lactamase class C family)
VAALGALKLAEQGKLDLDAPIEELATSWKPPRREFFAPVTTRLILAHRAGLSMHGVPSYARDDPAARGAREELSFRLKFLDEPGTRFRYSGGGFMILEVILEDLTATSFNTFMRQEILVPLKMQSSTFEPYHAPFAPHMAMGYYANGKPVGWRCTGGLAAAWLHTTPSDLARFCAAVYRAHRRGETNVITPRTARLMLTPTGEATEREGAFTSLGFFIADTPVGRVVFHEGSNRGYRCGMWIFLRTGNGLVVMTNSNNGRALCDDAYAAVFPGAAPNEEKDR